MTAGSRRRASGPHLTRGTGRRPARVFAVILAAACVLICAGSASASGGAVRGYRSLLGLETQFMCLSCHEPLELVGSPQAQAEKAVIARLLAHGDSASQIRAAMVAQYGVQVLAKPPARGFNLALYVLPPALLVLGAAALIYTLPKWRARARSAAQTPLQGAPPLATADAERLDDELAKFI